MLYVFLFVFVAIMLIGTPVAYALGGTALIAGALFWGIPDLPLGTLAQRVVYGANSFPLLALPLFLLAGQLMNGGSISRRIFGFAENVVGHVRGALGHVNIIASIIFSGMSGTAAADAAGLGTIEIKAMTDAGYDLDFSTAVTGASSLIGPIIPPSVPMVMYGVLASVSVGSLFIGGIIPGLLMGASLMVMVTIYAVARNYPKGERPTLKSIFISIYKAFLPLMTPVIIVGGIWTGVFTPTEAAAVAVVYALFLNLVLYRDMSLPELWRIVKHAVFDSASVLFIIACAYLYGYVLVRTQIPMILAEALFKVTDSKLGIVLILNGFLLIVGCFMSTMEAIILFTPIIVPMLQMAGIDLLFFGVIMCLNLMIGQLTPPFGIVLFVLTKVSKLSMDRVVKAAFPFTIPILIVLLLCIFFPPLVTWLPRTVFGR